MAGLCHLLECSKFPASSFQSIDNWQITMNAFYFLSIYCISFPSVVLPVPLSSTPWNNIYNIAFRVRCAVDI